MIEAKNTARALVRIGYDGRVHKTFRATNAKERFDNEVKVLRYLEQRGCHFVPRLLEADPTRLALRLELPEIARRLCNYEVLAREFRSVVEAAVARPTPGK